MKRSKVEFVMTMGKGGAKWHKKEKEKKIDIFQHGMEECMSEK